MKRQTGFTLIELVMVIVILGILAAAALPKFVNLKGEAQTAALEGVAGSLNSALAMNRAIRGLNPNSGVTTVQGNAGVNQACTIIFNGILQGGLPEPYFTATNTENQNNGTGGITIAGNAVVPKSCLLGDGVTSMVVPVYAIP